MGGIFKNCIRRRAHPYRISCDSFNCVGLDSASTFKRLIWRFDISQITLLKLFLAKQGINYAISTKAESMSEYLTMQLHSVH